MNPNEYDWQMGALAAMDPYLAPDERLMQPPSPDDPWPYQRQANPGEPEKWREPPTQLARWPTQRSEGGSEQEQVAAAAEAAAEQLRARYRNPLARDPSSNQMGAIAEVMAPQNPIDYALLASGPLRALAVPARAAVYGGALAVHPEEALAGKDKIAKGAAKLLSKGEKATGFDPTNYALGSILGTHPTTSARRIYDQTMKGGGYSVNLPSGANPTEGLMVGRYANTDPRNVVVPKEEFKQAVIKQHAATNAEELAKEERYLGTWVGPDGKVYLDVSQRFPADKLRLATKTGERTGQLSGYNVGAGESFPIGNWRDFVASPEFRDRMNTMEKVGRDYLNQYPTKEWWDMHGSPFERVYGEENLPQVAGFSAATAPVSNPYDNMRVMSAYMGRHIRGEPIIQPDYRTPEGGMWLAPGKQIPMERARVPNLEKAARGDLEALQRAKVREEAKAMSGDPSAVVLDRHWARISEDPSRGIFANVEEGVINTGTPKKGIGDYDFVKAQVSDAAKARDRDPRDYSADVWTGIRETIKNTSQLFGTKYRGSAITGESKSYADVFDELVERKAKHLGITVKELDKRLRSGDADLLSTMMVGSPVLWGAYKAWETNKPMGALARQDQYD